MAHALNDALSLAVTAGGASAANRIATLADIGGGGLTLNASTLAGRGSAGGSGAAQQITLGTNLSMSGTTLNASGGGGGGSLEVQQDGVAVVATATILNFTGNQVQVTDEGGGAAGVEISFNGYFPVGF